MSEKGIETKGLEIVTEKATELKKKEFYIMLAGAEEGLTLTVDRVGNVYKSKYANDDGTYSSRIFIDYSFTNNSKKYEVGIDYNLKLPNPEGKFTLTSNFNIFKIIGIATDISKAEEIKVTEEFIQDSLTGITFKAKIGTSFNGTFLIEPIELIS